MPEDLRRRERETSDLSSLRVDRLSVKPRAQPHRGPCVSCGTLPWWGASVARLSAGPASFYTVCLMQFQTIFFAVAVLLDASLVTAQHSDAVQRSPHAWVVIEDSIELPTGAAPPAGVGENTDRGETSGNSATPERRALHVLLHIPPRIPVAGATPAPDLRVARVARLAKAPAHLVSVGLRVYAIMPADESGTHRVGSSRVFARGLRDLWGSDPARRLEVLPAIESPVVAAAADTKSPLVVVERDADGQRVLEVQRLSGSQWQAVGGPIGASDTSNVGLVCWGGLIHVVELLPQGYAWHTLAGDSWESERSPNPAGLDTSALRLAGAWQDELVAIEQSASGPDRVVALSRGGNRVIASVPDGAWSGSAILADPGRLVLVSTSEGITEDADTTLPSPGVKLRSVTIAEISLTTGVVLAMGEATASSPVSRGEFQSLALLLIGAMVVVLVVVVRPPPAAAEPVLPPGTAIAPAGRRLIASLCDLVPSLIVTSLILDITILETLGPLALPATGSVDILPLLLVLGLSAAHSALGEMITGRSLGKMLTGTFVARVDPVPGVSPEAGRFRPPTPGGAVLRNVLKWFLFPATAIVLSDPSGRHRGDLFARSAVLVPISVPE